MKTVKVNVWQDKRNGSYECWEIGSWADAYNSNITEFYRLIKTIEIDVSEPVEEKEWQWLWQFGRKPNEGFEFEITPHFSKEEDARKWVNDTQNYTCYMKASGFEFVKLNSSERPVAKKTVRKEINGTVICSTVLPNKNYLTICDYLPYDATNIKVSYDTKE